MKRLRNQRGQVIILTVMMMTVILGMVGLTVDVGSWWHSERKIQAGVDAAARAGAELLPEDTSGANAAASSYGGLNGVTPTFSSPDSPPSVRLGDSIKVSVTQSAPAFFTKLFGVSSMNITKSAQGSAQIYPSATLATSIGLSCNAAPLGSCANGFNCSTSCFTAQTYSFDARGRGDSFAVINIANASVGNGAPAQAAAAASQLKTPSSTYRVAPGTYAAFTNGALNAQGTVGDAIDDVVGLPLVVPIWSSINGNGSNQTASVVGWGVFVLSGECWKNQTKTSHKNLTCPTETRT